MLNCEDQDLLFALMYAALFLISIEYVPNHNYTMIAGFNAKGKNTG